MHGACPWYLCTIRHKRQGVDPVRAHGRVGVRRAEKPLGVLKTYQFSPFVDEDRIPKLDTKTNLTTFGVKQIVVEEGVHNNSTQISLSTNLTNGPLMLYKLYVPLR